MDNVRTKIYEEFKVKEILGSRNYKTGNGEPSPDKVAVVTDDEDELVIVEIPSHIKHPKAVAKAIAIALTNSNFALTDLI